jgi:hypothetical protein
MKFQAIRLLEKKNGSSVNIHLKYKWDNSLGLSNLVG